MNTIQVGWMVGSVVLAQTGSPTPPSAPPPSGPALSSETTGAGPAPVGTTGIPTDGSGGAPNQPPRSGQGFMGPEFLWIILLMFVVMILISSMGGRKEKKRRAEMLAGLARNDKVHTVGGLIGTIAEVHEQEIVLRTDEASNTRVRVARSSISQVIKPAGRPGTPEVEAKPGVPARV